MEFKRPPPSVKLMSNDGRVLAKVRQPATPNLPDIIIMGERVFVNRDHMGYRETIPYPVTQEDLVFVKDEPQRGPCLAGGCVLMASEGATFCAAHQAQHDGHAETDEEATHAPRRGRR